MGYTYADTGTAMLIAETLASSVVGRSAFDIPGAWEAQMAVSRNLGHPGVVSMAVSAVDAALWDLKAHLLGLSLSKLLGQTRWR
jgi:L-alanine-DL-glutamate epimerase-like enolase superfamily enzyme